MAKRNSKKRGCYVTLQPRRRGKSRGFTVHDMGPVELQEFIEGHLDQWRRDKIRRELVGEIEADEAASAA